MGASRLKLVLACAVLLVQPGLLLSSFIDVHSGKCRNVSMIFTGTATWQVWGNPFAITLNRTPATEGELDYVYSSQQQDMLLFEDQLHNLHIVQESYLLEHSELAALNCTGALEYESFLHDLDAGRGASSMTPAEQCMPSARCLFSPGSVTRELQTRRSELVNKSPPVSKSQIFYAKYTAVCSSIEKMNLATARDERQECLMRGRKFVPPSDLYREDPYRTTASRMKYTGEAPAASTRAVNTTLSDPSASTRASVATTVTGSLPRAVNNTLSDPAALTRASVATTVSGTLPRAVNNTLSAPAASTRTSVATPVTGSLPRAINTTVSAPSASCTVPNLRIAKLLSLLANQKSTETPQRSPHNSKLPCSLSDTCSNLSLYSLHAAQLPCQDQSTSMSPIGNITVTAPEHREHWSELNNSNHHPVSGGLSSELSSLQSSSNIDFKPKSDVSCGNCPEQQFTRRPFKILDQACKKSGNDNDPARSYINHCLPRSVARSGQQNKQFNIAQLIAGEKQDRMGDDGPFKSNYKSKDRGNSYQHHSVTRSVYNGCLPRTASADVGKRCRPQQMQDSDIGCLPRTASADVGKRCRPQQMQDSDIGCLPRTASADVGKRCRPQQMQDSENSNISFTPRTSFSKNRMPPFTRSNRAGCKEEYRPHHTNQHNIQDAGSHPPSKPSWKTLCQSANGRSKHDTLANNLWCKTLLDSGFFSEDCSTAQTSCTTLKHQCDQQQSKVIDKQLVGGKAEPSEDPEDNWNLEKSEIWDKNTSQQHHFEQFASDLFCEVLDSAGDSAVL